MPFLSAEFMDILPCLPLHLDCTARSSSLQLRVDLLRRVLQAGFLSPQDLESGQKSQLCQSLITTRYEPAKAQSCPNLPFRLLPRPAIGWVAS